MSSAPIGSYPALPPYLSSQMTQTQRTGQNNDGPGAARRAATTPAHRLPVIDKSKVDPQVRAAGEGMEAMFIDYMMKVMRETVPKSDMDLESPATEIYRGMLDAETSQRAAKSGGVGIADQIIAYLESQKYTLPRGEMGGEMGRPPSPQGIQRVAQQAVKTVSPESPRSNEASADATMSNPGAHAANGIGGTTHENY